MRAELDELYKFYTASLMLPQAFLAQEMAPTLIEASGSELRL